MLRVIVASNLLFHWPPYLSRAGLDLTKRQNQTQMNSDTAFYFVAFLFQLDKAALVKIQFPLGRGLSG